MLKRFKRIVIAFLIVSLAVTYQPLTVFAKDYNDADDIKATIDSDETYDFDEEKFNDVCDDLTGEELDYVKFKLPDKDEGVLYYDYDEDEDDDNTKVSTSRKYSYSGSPNLSRVTFVPDEDFSGTVTIKYTGYNEDADTYSGKIKITVKGTKSSSSDTIRYTMKYSSDYIRFDEEDFNDICEDEQDEKLDYVKFILPDDDDGILYYNYDKSDDNNTEVSESKKYYYDKSPYLSRVAFVPDDDFSGTITIKYTGYDDEGDKYSGKISITVGDDDDDDDDDVITYKVDDSDDVIKFDEDDFNDLCDDLNDEDIDYVKFTIPSASKGILYYNYNNGQYSSIVTSSKKYYYEESPYLGDISFVPDDKFSGTCKIEFKGYDVNGDSFSGIVKIIVGSESDDAKVITYTSTPNTPVLMKDSDFNTVCREIMDNQLSYVYFTLPSASMGTLYYGYTDDENYSSKVRAATKYYYDGSPYLLNVAFVPAKNYSGTATISYTGYATDGLAYSGEVKISFSSSGTGNSTTAPIDNSTLVSSKYFSDVDTSYSWAVPYIDSLYESSIISGSTVNGSKLYSPASFVTRGDFMLILHRALDLKTTSTASNFSDVPSGSYYYDAIMTARALGIAQGSDNYFYPNNAITREDAMVFVLRAVNITGTTIPSGDTSSLTSFIDGSLISDYSKSAIAALIKAGIITGSDDNKIYPQGNLTRAQIAAIIYRVKNN